MNIEDVTDLICPDENELYFSDENSMELYQTCIHLMEDFIEEYPDIITDPDFDEIFDENIHELMNALFENDIFYNEDAQYEMTNIIHHAKEDYFKHHIPPRSYSETVILKEPKYDILTAKINKLRN